MEVRNARKYICDVADSGNLAAHIGNNVGKPEYKHNRCSIVAIADHKHIPVGNTLSIHEWGGGIYCCAYY